MYRIAIKFYLWLSFRRTNSICPCVTETDSISSQPLCGNVSSIASLPAPVHCEAEELRRQQLAIEREVESQYIFQN